METRQVQRWFPRILLALIGPLLGAIVSIALRLTTELTVSIVLFVLFLILVVFAVDHRLAAQNEQSRQSYEKFVHVITERFPCELIQGHTLVEQTYVRLLDSARTELVAIGLGVDLSAEKWKAEIGPYLNATDMLLAREVAYRRIQLLAPAPIEWLKYIHKVMTDPQNMEDFDVRFVELSPDFFYHRLFQVFVVDDTEVCFFVNIETASRDEEFAISLTDRGTVNQLKRHILSTSWEKARKYSADELADIIAEQESRRLTMIKKRVASYLRDLIDRQERYLGIVGSIDEFTKVSGRDILDEYLHKRVMAETVKIWRQISALDESAKSETVEKWIASTSPQH